MLLCKNRLAQEIRIRKEVSMYKTSVAARVVSFAVLVTLLLASFPTAAAAAKTNNRGLETKWAKLVDSYNRQSLTHNSAQHWVTQWMINNRKAPYSKKADIQRYLASSNTAWVAATFIAMRHNGFDANGKVIDKAAAQQSINDLAQALQRHAGAIRNLKRLLHQYSKQV
jgi:hypothetical protein